MKNIGLLSFVLFIGLLSAQCTSVPLRSPSHLVGSPNKQERAIAQTTTQVVAQSAKEVEASLVEYNNCLLSQQRFPSFLGNDRVECNNDYLLYESAIASRKTSNKLKIGSFNIIRIGQPNYPFKRNDMVAQIINQWDLVGVVEIMNTDRQYLEHNAEIDRIKNISHKISDTDFEKSYEMPRYLMLLKELRKLDPSWSLIMAGHGHGEVPAQYEYAGFLYRKGVVANQTTTFCSEKRGCLTPVIREKYENLISRLPFVARFDYGKLEFNAAVLHTRFRAPTKIDCKLGEAAGRPVAEIKKCIHYTTEEVALITELNRVTGRAYPNENDSRFLELAVSARELTKSPEEVLLMGDFNLEAKPSNERSWQFALGTSNKKVFVREPTSISEENGLVSEYDHFIFDHTGANLSKCDVSSARPFSFLLDPDNAQTKVSVLNSLADFLRQRKQNRAEALAEFIKEQNRDFVVMENKDGQVIMSPRYPGSTGSQRICKYDQRVLGNWKRRCEEDKKEKTEPDGRYLVHHHLISDHLPIMMECSGQ
jgi:hypothetical protein